MSAIWNALCWWLAAKLAPRDGSRWGPAVFGRSVLHDKKPALHRVRQ